MDLKRNAYEQMLAWKRRGGHRTLEVSGARQVGKTYLVNKFADKEYAHKEYINLLEMSGELLMDHYRQIREDMKNGLQLPNPVLELMRRYNPTFVDGENTVVIIDEIQESAEIYNRIREFTRYMKSDFIVTGSYLGRVLNKEFKYSAGDMVSLEIHTLDFEEFLYAVDAIDQFKSLDLFGGSESSVYECLSKWYKIYCQIGGYPAVVLRYLEEQDIKACQDELISIIKLFTNESRRYFSDILDYEAYENLFCSVARLLVKEKKGLKEDSFSEELQSIVVKDYSSNLGKAAVNRAIDWLHSCGIIGFAGKVTNCNIMDFRAKARCYFLDVGLTTYFLQSIGCDLSDINGVVNENFVYLNLRSRINNERELAPEMPAFATFGAGELDFFAKSLNTGKVYGIEVKTGKNSSKTSRDVLNNKKVDVLVYAKGNTHGGVEGNIYTIPIYGISKFEF